MKLPQLGVLVAGAFGALVAVAKSPGPLERTAPVPADQPIPTLDFFRPALLETPELNATGTHLAALVTTGRDSKRVMTVDLATGKVESVAGPAKRDFYDFVWLDPKRLVLYLRNEKLYADGLYSAVVGRLPDAYAIDQWNAGSIIGVPRARPTRPIYWIRQNAYDDGKDGGVVELDATKPLHAARGELPGTRGVSDENSVNKYGTAASIVKKYPALPDGYPYGFLADRQGELAFGFSAVNGVSRLYCLTKEGWVRSPLDTDGVDVLDVGDAPGEVIVLTSREAGKPRAVCRANAFTGEIGAKLLQDARYECEDASFYHHPADGRLLGMRYSDVARKALWFDEKYAAAQRRLEASFPGLKVSVLGSDPAENRFIVATYSDRQPVEYVQVDFAAGSAGRIKQTRPWIDAQRMQPMKPIRFKTRDGVALDAYLTLPAGATKESPAPLVVLAHGGPWARDEWGWNGEVQFLASRGYAVLQPNYRGSSGYDALYPSADRYEFRKMHDDVTDSVAAVVKMGFVDADRIAIMGTSFGGYLAACGAAFEPARYRCAITIAGVFDWSQHMKQARRNDSSWRRFEFYRSRLGDPEKQKEKFDAISPINQVRAIQVPVFVAHGRADSVVDVEQSKRLVSELKKFNVPHVAHFERGEGHGMSYVENEVELYEGIEKFLTTNLAPRAKVAAK